MSNTLNPETGFTHPMVYQIRLRGHLGPQWKEWLGGLDIALEDNGDTLLTGPVADQASLHGVLKKVRDLGMPLLSVNCMCHKATVSARRSSPFDSGKPLKPTGEL
ncbi:MAG: hypothetical protein H6557_08060 [Lewinellaceae bacterium]|nr:hypothetical protein [Phaeodactylibacter sp.]MCB9036557.1 hypothetical protein [Lewinellaceae bacterium]